MSKNNKKLYLIVFIAVVSVLMFSLTWRQDLQVEITEYVNSKNTEKITLILGQETLQLSFASNTIFYDALQEAKNAGILNFNGKNYPGLGFFVTDIGDLHSGGGKNLLYYVNGKEATVGVSSYTLKDGDIIEWKLE